jgi:mRNA interferase MazF
LVTSYVPDAGDLVWLDFDPQAGHEQAGLRPAVTLSSKYFNLRSSVAFACPYRAR